MFELNKNYSIGQQVLLGYLMESLKVYNDHKENKVFNDQLDLLVLLEQQVLLDQQELPDQNEILVVLEHLTLGNDHTQQKQHMLKMM